MAIPTSPTEDESNDAEKQAMGKATQHRVEHLFTKFPFCNIIMLKLRICSQNSHSVLLLCGNNRSVHKIPILYYYHVEITDLFTIFPFCNISMWK